MMCLYIYFIRKLVYWACVRVFGTGRKVIPSRIPFIKSGFLKICTRSDFYREAPSIDLDEDIESYLNVGLVAVKMHELVLGKK